MQYAIEGARLASLLKACTYLLFAGLSIHLVEINRRPANHSTLQASIAVVELSHKRYELHSCFFSCEGEARARQ